MATYFTFENIYKAYISCKKRKTRTLNHLQFSERLEENIFKLESELTDRTYRPGRSIAFIVQKPKIREIFAAEFRDRVIHHLLFSYLSPIYERYFIYDSWACREHKGTHGAMLRIKKFVGELEKDSPGFYLKMDIKSYFTSIDQEILYNLIAKRVKNEEILWLAKTIIFHDCAHDVEPKIQSQPSLFEKLPKGKSLFSVRKGKGLPIGNLTSQFFANVYLNELDQFVKHKLKARRYVRYVDDFVILEKDKAILEYYRTKITEFVGKRLLLTAHPEKQFISPIQNGIDFVGYLVKQDYILVRKRVIGEWRRRMDCTDRKLREKVFTSYVAHSIWANTLTLRKKIAKKLLLPSRVRPLTAIKAPSVCK